jgi:replicative DNA helicase
VTPRLRDVSSPIRTNDPNSTLLFDLHAEAAVLGNLLFDFDRTGKSLPTLTSDCFYSEAHRQIFEAIEALATGGKAVGIETVFGALRDSGRSAKVGLPLLTELTLGAAVLSARTLRELGEKLLERAARRKARELGALLSIAAEQDGTAFDAILQSTREKLDGLSSELAASSDVEVALTTVAETARDIREAAEGKSPSVTTGFPSLDALLGGGLRSELVVLGARAGTGKTSLASSIAMHVAEFNGGVFFKPFEARKVLMARSLASRSGLCAQRVLSGKIDPSEWSRFTRAADEVSRLPILVDHEQAVTGAQLCARARRAKTQLARSGVTLRLVVIDYLQELQPPRAGMPNRQEAVAENVRRLRDVAGELDVCVLGLSQLNRGAEEPDRRPRVSDLRESGQIEQDARVVLLLWTKGLEAELNVAKANNGPTGVVPLAFDPPRLRFTDPAQAELYDQGRV